MFSRHFWRYFGFRFTRGLMFWIGCPFMRAKHLPKRMVPMVPMEASLVRILIIAILLKGGRLRQIQKCQFCTKRLIYMKQSFLLNTSSCCFVSTAHSDDFALAQNRAMQRMKDQLRIGWTKSLQGFQQTHPLVQKQTCRMKQIWTWSCRLPPKLERLEPASVMLKKGRAWAQLLALGQHCHAWLLDSCDVFFPKFGSPSVSKREVKTPNFRGAAAMNFFSGGFYNQPWGAPGFFFLCRPAKPRWPLIFQTSNGKRRKWVRLPFQCGSQICC